MEYSFKEKTISDEDSFVRYYNLIDKHKVEMTTCNACLVDIFDDSQLIDDHVEKTSHLNKLVISLEQRLKQTKTVAHVVMNKRYLIIHKMVLFKERTIYCMICSEKIQVSGNLEEFDAVNNSADVHIRTSPKHVQHLIDYVHNLYDSNLILDKRTHPLPLIRQPVHQQSYAFQPPTPPPSTRYPYTPPRPPFPPSSYPQILYRSPVQANMRAPTLSRYPPAAPQDVSRYPPIFPYYNSYPSVGLALNPWSERPQNNERLDSCHRNVSLFTTLIGVDSMIASSNYSPLSGVLNDGFRGSNFVRPQEQSARCVSDVSSPDNRLESNNVVQPNNPTTQTTGNNANQLKSVNKTLFENGAIQDTFTNVGKLIDEFCGLDEQETTRDSSSISRPLVVGKKSENDIYGSANMSIDNDFNADILVATESCKNVFNSDSIESILDDDAAITCISMLDIDKGLSGSDTEKEGAILVTGNEDISIETEKEVTVLHVEKGKSVSDTENEDIIPNSKREDSVFEGAILVSKKEDTVSDTEEGVFYGDSYGENSVLDTGKDITILHNQKEEKDHSIIDTEIEGTILVINKEDSVSDTEKADRHRERDTILNSERKDCIFDADKEFIILDDQKESAVLVYGKEDIALDSEKEVAILDIEKENADNECIIPKSVREDRVFDTDKDCGILNNQMGGAILVTPDFEREVAISDSEKEKLNAEKDDSPLNTEKKDRIDVTDDNNGILDIEKEGGFPVTDRTTDMFADSTPASDKNCATSERVQSYVERVNQPNLISFDDKPIENGSALVFEPILQDAVSEGESTDSIFESSQKNSQEETSPITILDLPCNKVCIILNDSAQAATNEDYCSDEDDLGNIVEEPEDLIKNEATFGSDAASYSEPDHQTKTSPSETKNKDLTTSEPLQMSYVEKCNEFVEFIHKYYYSKNPEDNCASNIEKAKRMLSEHRINVSSGDELSCLECGERFHIAKLPEHLRGDAHYEKCELRLNPPEKIAKSGKRYTVEQLKDFNREKILLELTEKYWEDAMADAASILSAISKSSHENALERYGRARGALAAFVAGLRGKFPKSAIKPNWSRLDAVSDEDAVILRDNHIVHPQHRKFTCKLCDATLNSVISCKLHIDGKNHTAKMTANNQAISNERSKKHDTVDRSSPELKNNVEVDCVSVESLLKNKVVKVGSYFYCESCCKYIKTLHGSLEHVETVDHIKKLDSHIKVRCSSGILSLI